MYRLCQNKKLHNFVLNFITIESIQLNEILIRGTGVSSTT